MRCGPVLSLVAGAGCAEVQSPAPPTDALAVVADGRDVGAYAEHAARERHAAV